LLIDLCAHHARRRIRIDRSKIVRTSLSSQPTKKCRSVKQSELDLARPAATSVVHAHALLEQRHRVGGTVLGSTGGASTRASLGKARRSTRSGSCSRKRAQPADGKSSPGRRLRWRRGVVWILRDPCPAPGSIASDSPTASAG
jgi:hypothetical protein